MSIVPEDKEQKSVGGVFTGTAKVGEILAGFSQVALTQQDLTSPIAIQMAMSRIYEAMTKGVESGPKRKFVAEVKFVDSMGNPIVLALDLGDKTPPFMNKDVKARILIELAEEQPSTF